MSWKLYRDHRLLTVTSLDRLHRADVDPCIALQSSSRRPCGSAHSDRPLLLVVVVVIGQLALKTGISSSSSRGSSSRCSVMVHCST